MHNREINVMDKDNLFYFCSFEYIIINLLAEITNYSESNALTSAAHLRVYSTCINKCWPVSKWVNCFWNRLAVGNGAITYIIISLLVPVDAARWSLYKRTTSPHAVSATQPPSLCHRSQKGFLTNFNLSGLVGLARADLESAAILV